MLSALKALTQADLVAAINELLAAVRGGVKSRRRNYEAGEEHLVFLSGPPFF